MNIKGIFSKLNTLGNLKYYYMIQIFIIFGLNLNFAISFVYPLTFGLNFMQMMFLYFSLTHIVSFIFNIPTGIFADKYSVKLCLVLGFLAFGIALILRGTLPFIIDPFMAFVCSEILVGFGGAILSGANEKYLYSFKDKITDTTIFSLITTITFWTQAIGILVGGIVITYLSMAWTQIIGGCIAVIGSLCGIFFFEEPVFKKSDKSNFSVFKEGAFYIIKNKEILYRVIGAALITLTICGSRNVFQPLLVNLGLNIHKDARILSIIFTLQMILGGLGSLIISNIEKYLNLKFTMFMTFLFMGILLLLLTISGNMWLAAIIIILFGLFEGAQYPEYNILMNRAITNENIRATVLSIDTFIGSVILMIFIGYIGYLTDLYGINANLYITGGLCIIGSFITSYIYFKNGK